MVEIAILGWLSHNATKHLVPNIAKSLAILAKSLVLFTRIWVLGHMAAGLASWALGIWPLCYPREARKALHFLKVTR